MTLDDAIQHLRDSLADPTHEWGCDECKAEHEQLLEWLENYKTLSETAAITLEHVKELKKQNDELLKRGLNSDKECWKLTALNGELKCMLRTAIHDLDLISIDGNCCFPYCDDICPFDCVGGCESMEWKHRDEAMKLIGGDTSGCKT